MTIPHGRAPQNSRTMDTITRIYKNAAGEVLAIHEVNIVVTQMSVPRKASSPNDQFEMRNHRSGILDPVLTRMNKQAGQDRVISSILHIGNYSSYQEGNGTLQKVIYSGSADTNDLVLDLNNLPQIGDTI